MEKKIENRRNIFHARMQQPFESFDHYLSALQLLVKDCRYQQDVEYLEMNKQIIKGINYRKLQQKLQSRTYDYYCNQITEKSVLEETIDICRGIDRARDERELRIKRARQKFEELKAQKEMRIINSTVDHYIGDESTLMCDNCDKILDRNEKCRNCLECCSYCGNYGHFGNQCRMKNSREISKKLK